MEARFAELLRNTRAVDEVEIDENEEARVTLIKLMTSEDRLAIAVDMLQAVFAVHDRYQDIMDALLGEILRLVVGEYTAATSCCFLLLPVAPSVSCSCSDALNTPSSKLPPSPAVSCRLLLSPNVYNSSKFTPQPPSTVYVSIVRRTGTPASRATRWRRT